MEGSPLTHRMDRDACKVSGGLGVMDGDIIAMRERGWEVGVQEGSARRSQRDGAIPR